MQLLLCHLYVLICSCFLFPSAFVNVCRDWYFSMLSGMDPLSAALILLRGFRNNRWTWDTCVIVIAHVEVCTDDLNKIDLWF